MRGRSRQQPGRKARVGTKPTPTDGAQGRGRPAIGVADGAPLPHTDALGQRNHVWVDTSTVSRGSEYTTVELFCGAGGITLGFTAAGYRSLLGVDSDPDAVATFQSNFPLTEAILGDIREVSDGQLLPLLGGRTPDVLGGGWPCQGITTSGVCNPSDPRNTLYRQVVRLARLLRPRVVVLENVRNLVSDRYRPLAVDLLRMLADAGYPDGSLMVLNAAAYGVPQERRRVIIVANRCGRPNPYPIPVLAEKDFRTVDSAIGDLMALPRGAVPNHIWSDTGLKGRMAATPHGKPLTADYPGGCRRLHPNRPAFTVMGTSNQPHIHPHQDRFLSVREMARPQGFPDEFILEGSLSQQQIQVGNAVPTPLAEHVALAVRTLLDGVTRGHSPRGWGASPRAAHLTQATGEAIGTAGAQCGVRPTAEASGRIRLEDGRYLSLVPVESHHHTPHPGAPVGSIIEGGNLDALTILRETHAGAIDAIFIDPPYNTGTTESYENSFDDAEWVDDISASLRIARDLLTPDGVICISIDHVQLFNLGSAADAIFGKENRLAIVAVVHNQKGRSGWDADGFNEINEYYIFYQRGPQPATVGGVPIPEAELRRRFPETDDTGRFCWIGLTRGGGGSRPEETPGQHYPIHIDPATGRMALQPLQGSIGPIWPVAEDGSERVWRCIPATFERWCDEGELRIHPSRTHPSGYTIQKKTRPTLRMQPKTVWGGPQFNAAAHGTVLLRRMIGDNPFSYAKSVHAVNHALGLVVGHKPNATVLDFYAGSGTTAHAVLMMNAEDGGNRRFILVTNNELTRAKRKPNRHICEEICLPRVRAAIDGYDYRSGRRTIHVDGLPGNLRYYRVELARKAARRAA